MTLGTPANSSAHANRPVLARQAAFVLSHWRLDVVGLVAVVIAGAALGGTVVLLRTPTIQPHVERVSGGALAPVRDQWYLERPTLLTSSRAALPPSPVKDRWYDDMPSTARVGAPTRAPVKGDTWYLEGWQTAAVSQPKHQDVVRDRWYTTTSGGIRAW